MGLSRERMEEVAGAGGAPEGAMSTYEGQGGAMSAPGAEAGRTPGREDVGRFVSPLLRQVLAAADSAARDELLGAGAGRLRWSGAESLEAVLTELLEDVPGSFYPVYNAERERWELGIG